MEVEDHSVFGAHGADDAPAGAAVVLADEEGEVNETDLALVDLEEVSGVLSQRSFHYVK